MIQNKAGGFNKNIATLTVSGLSNNRNGLLIGKSAPN